MQTLNVAIWKPKATKMIDNLKGVSSYLYKKIRVLKALGNNLSFLSYFNQ